MKTNYKKLLGKDIRENGFRDIVENVIDTNIYSKAPLTNSIATNYNLRERLYTLQFYNLTYRYCTDGIFKTLIQQPIIDAFKDFKIVSDLIDEEEKDKLLNLFFEKDLKSIIQDFFFIDRLYGGAILYEDDKQEYSVLNRWEITNTLNNDGITSDYYNTTFDNDIYYLGEKLNKNNLIVLKGVKAPYFIEKMLNGWGLSVVEPLIEPSNLYQKTMNLIYELLDESKIDVYKVEGLKDSVLAGQDKSVVDKIQLTNMLKNFQNAIVLDNNDNFEQKQLTNITAIVDIVKELKLDICSCMKIPAIILWGMSPSGFSSGEYDLLQYQDKIKQEIQPKLKKVLLKVLKRLATENFDMDVEDMDIEFENYTLETRESQENINDKLFQRANQLFQMKLLTKKEYFTYLKNNNIFTETVKCAEEDEYNDNMEEMGGFDMNSNNNQDNNETSKSNFSR